MLLLISYNFYNNFIEMNLELFNKGLNKIREENIYKKDENLLKFPIIKEEEQKIYINLSSKNKI